MTVTSIVVISIAICPYCGEDVLLGQYFSRDEKGDIVHNSCAFSGDEKKTFPLKEKKGGASK
jgi:hypothetical protein